MWVRPVARARATIAVTFPPSACSGCHIHMPLPVGMDGCGVTAAAVGPTAAAASSAAGADITPGGMLAEGTTSCEARRWGADLLGVLAGVRRSSAALARG